MQPLYLILLVASLSFPLGASFENRVHYYARWKALLPGIITTAAFFLVWDYMFTDAGIWGFNEAYTLAYRLLGMPIEEWLFFVIIPFCTVFIYECVRYFFPGVSTTRGLQLIVLVLAILLLLLSIIYSDRAYTFWNFMFAGAYLLFIYVRNPVWLGKFAIAYLFHLIPFMIINGVLTGSFLESPIVWYNDDENLGIRIFTVPIEDTVYSLLLLLMNVTFLEYFKKRYNIQT